MSILLDGKKLQKKKSIELKERVLNLIKNGIKPHLVVIQVGCDAASKIYIANKQKMCNELGIISTKIEYDSEISMHTLLSKIEQLNNDNSVHGILVQFPLPKHLKSIEVINAISPNKDADGLHPQNQLYEHNSKKPYPCTSKGILEFLKEYKIEIKNKNVAILGRSKIVGKPTSNMLISLGANVFVAHSGTNKKTIIDNVKNADILISATGVKDVIDANLIKKDSVVIDVGIIRENKKIRGDIDFEIAKKRASYLTPVPGGVGPMTVIMLMDNLIALAENIS